MEKFAFDLVSDKKTGKFDIAISEKLSLVGFCGIALMQIVKWIF